MCTALPRKRKNEMATKVPSHAHDFIRLSLGFFFVDQRSAYKSHQWSELI
jgi:hypothetical protein